VSAFRGSNASTGALAEFLAAVQSGRVTPGSILIVESLDRLSRDDIDEAYELFRKLIKSGIAIATKSPKRVYSVESCRGNFLNLLEPLFIMYRANEESATKSYRLSQVWGQRKRRAIEDGEVLTRMTPAWIEVVEEDGKLKYRLIPDRARTVRHIVLWSIEGLGVQKILKRLNDEPGEYPCFSRTGIWGERYLTRILCNPATFGQYQPHVIDAETGKKKPQGEPVKGYFPAVVSETEFSHSRSLMVKRDRRGGRPSSDPAHENLFTHLVWLAGDRARMTMRTVKPAPSVPNRSLLRYLVSSTKKTGTMLRGQARSFPFEAFEKAVLTNVLELKLTDIADPSLAGELEERIKNLTGELTELDHKIEMLAGKINEKGVSQTAMGRYMEWFEQATAEKEEKITELEQLKQDAASGRPETMGEVQTMVEMLFNATTAEEVAKIRRRLKTRLKSLIETIWVHIERFGHGCFCCHYQIFLKGGSRRDGHVWSRTYRGLRLPPPDDVAIVNLEEVDLRKGPPAQAAVRSRAGG
jgi:DNA invertase Pin-like site-specific DNA recombinase